MKRSRYVWPVVLAIVFAAVASAIYAFFNAGYWLQAPAQTPVGADAIVVLGGDDGQRSLKALDLYRSGYAPLVVLTGLERGSAAPPPSLTWRASFLEARGLPRANLRFEVKARNSYEEAADILALMRREAWHTVIIVSDPPHMRRLAWTWTRAFEGSGLSYVLVASEPDWWSPGAWWRDETSGAFVIMEWIKLTYYVLKDRSLEPNR
jgi:uncharacterized SAM-binding protein YcdF (DUF218 family)